MLNKDLTVCLLYNVFRSYEVDDTFPNTVVVTIDATHHMRMSPGLMRHVHGQMQGPNLHTFSSSSMDQSKQFFLIKILVFFFFIS